jgi:hypothetical protein
MEESLRYTVLAVKPSEVIDYDFSARLKHNEILAFVILKCSLRVICDMRLSLCLYVDIKCCKHRFEVKSVACITYKS